MRNSVDAAGEAGDDREPIGGEATDDFAHRLSPVGGCTPRPYDRDAPLVLGQRLPRTYSTGGTSMISASRVG